MKNCSLTHAKNNMSGSIYRCNIPRVGHTTSGMNLCGALYLVY